MIKLNFDEAKRAKKNTHVNPLTSNLCEAFVSHPNSIHRSENGKNKIKERFMNEL